MLSLGVLVAGSAMAQQAPQKEKKHRTEIRDGKDRKQRKSPEERAALRTEKMSKELGLNKSQTKKLEALNLKQAREMEAKHANYKHGDRRDKNQREEMQASREKWNNELKDILSKKQYAQYEEKRQEMRAHRKDRNHEGFKNRGERHQEQRSK
ncbi:hypothetical protein GCM10028895_28710 [Pontibacter rugosus]